MLKSIDVEDILYNPTTGFIHSIGGVRLDTNDKEDKSGYSRVRINGVIYLSHRVAWFIANGNWPEVIDHINGVRSDNSLSNLRSVTQQDNSKNCKLSINNTSGYNGVYWNKTNKRWIANITIDGKTKYLGSYKVLDEAIDSRKLANVKYGFHENHGSYYER